MGWAIALHGGAGMVSKAMPAAQREASEAALNEFLDAGIAALNDSRSALDVVELVVRLLENNPMFNSGVGSVLTSKGTVEMEASIMDGVTKKSGAVSGLSTVVNPISLARLVMEKTPHVYLAFDGAEAFARAQGVEIKDPSYFITEENQERLRKALKTGTVMLDHTASSGEPCETEKVHSNGIHSNGIHSNGVHDAKRAHSNGGISESEKVHSNGIGLHSNGRVSDADKAQFETVGCVAVDVYGNCAAATSTGGLVNKMVGRIGDTPLIGAGTYADENCAVSVTGKGEAIIQALVAKDVSALMEYKYLPLKEAVNTVVWKKLAEGTVGLIAVSASGEVAMPFNTLGMYRASATEDGLREVGIWDDVFSEDEDTKPEPVKYSLIN